MHRWPSCRPTRPTWWPTSTCWTTTPAHALLAQADAQLPSQVAQMNAAADRLDSQGPRWRPPAARVRQPSSTARRSRRSPRMPASTSRAIRRSTASGLAPVMRFQLSDPAAFEGFVGRLETAYGKKLDTANDRQAELPPLRVRRVGHRGDPGRGRQAGRGRAAAGRCLRRAAAPGAGPGSPAEEPAGRRPPGRTGQEPRATRRGWSASST